MPKTYSFTLALNGFYANTSNVERCTVARMACLHHMHGPDSITNIREDGEIPSKDYNPWDEVAAIKEKFGQKAPMVDQVRLQFGGHLPVDIRELRFPAEWFDRSVMPLDEVPDAAPAGSGAPVQPLVDPIEAAKAQFEASQAQEADGG